MTPNLSNRRPDDYGPLHPWRSSVPRSPKVTEAELAEAREYLAWIVTAVTAAARSRRR
jgi:hypothetical protein